MVRKINNDKYKMRKPKPYDWIRKPIAVNAHGNIRRALGVKIKRNLTPVEYQQVSEFLKLAEKEIAKKHLPAGDIKGYVDNMEKDFCTETLIKAIKT